MGSQIHQQNRIDREQNYKIVQKTVQESFELPVVSCKGYDNPQPFSQIMITSLLRVEFPEECCTHFVSPFASLRRHRIIKRLIQRYNRSGATRVELIEAVFTTLRVYFSPSAPNQPSGGSFIRVEFPQTPGAGHFRSLNGRLPTVQGQFGRFYAIRMLVRQYRDEGANRIEWVEGNQIPVLRIYYPAKSGTSRIPTVSL